MKASQAVRTLLQIAMGLLIMVGALGVEAVSSRRAPTNTLELTAPFRSGFYGKEHSSTLPGPYGAASRDFYWTQPRSSYRLWPAPAGAGLLHMEYLNPASGGYAQIALSDRSLGAVPPAAQLRMLHLLLPPADRPELEISQIEPITDGGRQLGLVISNLRWRSLGLEGGAFFSWAGKPLLAGLPLTVSLLAGLTLLLRLAVRWALLVPALAVGVTALVGLRWPWESRAMQPALQTLIGSALLGVALFYLPSAIRRQNPKVIVGAAWAITFVLFFSPVIQLDGTEYYAYVRSLFVDGDWRFINELDPLVTPFRTPNLAEEVTITGYTPNLASVGPAMVWTPFWLVAHGIALLGQGLGLGWSADGYDAPYIVLVTLSSALAGLLSMAGCFAIARRWFTAPVAALTAATIFLGSNLLFYALFEGSFAHSLSGATATWLVLATLDLDEQPSMRGWGMLGLAAGAMVVTYWITALLLVFPALIVGRLALTRLWRRDWRGIRELAAGGLLAAAVAALVFAPQLLAWKVLYGSWLAAPHGTDYITPRNIKLAKVLFSPLYGVAWWTPAYFAGLLGSLWFAVRRPWPGIPVLVAILVYMAYNASLGRWWAGGSFGMRRFAALAPFFAIGLAMLFKGLWRYPRAALALAGLLSGWCLRMTLRYVSYAIPHSPDVLGEMDLRTLLFSPTPAELRTAAAVAWNGWFGQLIRAPDLPKALVLGACLVLVAIVGISWRRYRQQVDQQHINASARTTAA